MCTNYKKILYCYFVALAMLSLGSAVNAGDDEDHDDNGFRHDSLGGEWWQHALSFINAENPILDETGEDCISGQHGKIWFLHGSIGNMLGPTERDCTVPEGVTLFFPILNVICVPFPGETIEENVGFCREFIDLVDTKRLWVDGRNRSRLIKRRTQTRAFPITMPEDNFFDLFGFDAPAGSYLAVGDGYYAKLRLREGDHVIRFKGGISEFGLEVDVIYNLHVVEPATSISPAP